MGGPTDVLMWEGPVGPCVALTHHTLANKVDPAHDEEREDDANDRPDGTAVGWGIIRGRLGDFCQGTEDRWSSLTTKEQAPVGSHHVPCRGWFCPGPAPTGVGNKEGGLWGAGEPC